MQLIREVCCFAPGKCASRIHKKADSDGLYHFQTLEYRDPGTASSYAHPIAATIDSPQICIGKTKKLLASTSSQVR